jgi:hypothetical protein
VRVFRPLEDPARPYDQAAAVFGPAVIANRMAHMCSRKPTRRSPPKTFTQVDLPVSQTGLPLIVVPPREFETGHGRVSNGPCVTPSAAFVAGQTACRLPASAAASEPDSGDFRAIPTRKAREWHAAFPNSSTLGVGATVAIQGVGGAGQLHSNSSDSSGEN